MAAAAGPRRSISGDLERSAVRLPLLPVEKKDRTVVSSYGQAVILGERPVIIGERINPTGKPRLKQALKDRDMAYILNMAASQEENGADILDVNVGLPGLDETAVMTETVRELQSVTDLRCRSIPQT